MHPNTTLFDTPDGARALARLRSEPVIWLSTISKDGWPQPRPVWFVWDEHTLLIYSMPQARKVAHIARDARVALHFDAGPTGEDVCVILGRAKVDGAAPRVAGHPAYVTKYADGMRGIGMTVAQYSAMFSCALRITPLRVRGLEPLPAA